MTHWHGAAEFYPVRIQRKRTKGWKMPEGAVYVGRPSRWGNPFPVDGPWIEASCVVYGYPTGPAMLRAMAVALYRWWMASEPVAAFTRMDREPMQLTEGTKGGAAWFHSHGVTYLPLRPGLEPLRGHDLACWCPLEDEQGNRVPCHADVLLELANPSA